MSALANKTPPSTYCQAIAAEFLTGDAGRSHLAHSVDTYSTKLDTLASALEKHFPAGFEWTKPEGGMFLWVKGPDGFDADTMVDRALGEGVAFLPGSVFHLDGTSHRNTMRLSFASVPKDDIDRGVELLAKLCEEAV